MAKGQKRKAYRRRVEARLQEMGYTASKYRWDAAPAGLTVIIGDAFRTFPLHAAQSNARTEHELGRLDTWAEVLNLKPAGTDMVRQIATAVSTPKRKAKVADPMQLDLEQLIAAQAKPNGAAHAGA